MTGEGQFQPKLVVVSCGLLGTVVGRAGGHGDELADGAGAKVGQGNQ